MRRELEVPIVFLSAAALLLSLLYLYPVERFANHGDLILNLGTEIIGILITLILIDSVLHQHEKHEQRKMRKIALEQLKNPLSRHLLFFGKMLKVSVESAPKEKYETPSDLFDDDFYEHIKHLDFSKIDNEGSSDDWATKSSDEFEDFHKSVGKILDRYSFYFDLEIVDLIESLVHSSFSDYMIIMPRFIELSAKHGFNNHNFLNGLAHNVIREYIELFCKLVNVYNGVFPDDQITLMPGLMGDIMYPTFGSARFRGDEQKIIERYLQIFTFPESS